MKKIESKRDKVILGAAIISVIAIILAIIMPNETYGWIAIGDMAAITCWVVLATIWLRCKTRR